jgi:hypothetical protein
MDVVAEAVNSGRVVYQAGIVSKYCVLGHKPCASSKAASPPDSYRQAVGIQP